MIADTLRSVQWFIGRLSVLMGLLATVCMVVITVVTLAEVFRRYVMGQSFLGVIELVETLMAFVFFALMSYTQYLKGHLRLTLFINHLPQRVFVPLETFVLFLIVCFIMLMVSQAWAEAILATEQRQVRFGAIPYPLWPAKLAAAAAISVMALQVLSDFIERLIVTVRGERPLTELGRPTSEADSV
jgi:TRAP-type C4-dicarboxylate transport system permease small subunit